MRHQSWTQQWTQQEKARGEPKIARFLFWIAMVCWMVSAEVRSFSSFLPGRTCRILGLAARTVCSNSNLVNSSHHKGNQWHTPWGVTGKFGLVAHFVLIIWKHSCESFGLASRSCLWKGVAASKCGLAQQFHLDMCRFRGKPSTLRTSIGRFLGQHFGDLVQIS